QQAYPGQKAHLVFGAVQHKDVSTVMRTLQPIAAHWHFTHFESPRAMPPGELRDLVVKNYGQSVPYSTHKSSEDALAAARASNEQVLVTGSLYLVGEVLSQLRGEKQWFQRSTQ
ncbi:MAG: hypothetical protein RL693_2152, partial [Verrucomicrobiota bacterium]